MIQENNSYKIRSITPNDKERLTLFRKELSDEDRIFFSFLEERKFEDFLDPVRFASVLIVEDASCKIIGYGHLEKFQQAHKQHVGRLGIALHPAHRGTGLSRSIMNSIIDIARSNGITKIWLSVHLDNIRALRLYEKFGFKPEGIFFNEEKRGGKTSDIVSMALHLTSVPPDKSIPWGKPAVETEEAAFLMKVLHSDWLSQGPMTALFEKKIAEYTGSKQAIVMNNGTSCLQAMFAVSFKRGQKVIFPAFTFVSTVNSALSVGVEPLLADIDPDTGNIDLDMVEDLLKKTPDIKGFVVVDLAGLPVDMKRCKEIIKKYNVKLIQDSAEAIGSACYGKRVGGFGHPSMFSFHAAKLITTIEGGAVTTDDEELALKMRKFRSHGESLEKKFIWDSQGLNLRSTDLQSAIGLAQLEKLDYFIKRRNEIAKYYKESLAGIVQFQKIEKFVDTHSYMMFIILFKDSAERSKVVEEFKKNNIFCRNGWLPLHKQPVFEQRFKEISLPVSEDWGRRSLCLPMFNRMTLDEAEKVSGAIKNAIKKG